MLASISHAPFFATFTRHHTAKDELQRALPPDLFRYCAMKGLLDKIIEPIKYSYEHS
jgi:hypothetical protein